MSKKQKSNNTIEDRGYTILAKPSKPNIEEIMKEHKTDKKPVGAKAKKQDNNDEVLTNEQSKLVEEFADLCRKLGKIVSRREVAKFMGWSYESKFLSFKELKEQALELYPDLERLQQPVRVGAPDVEQYRLGLQANKDKQANKKEVSTASTLDYISQFAEKTFSGKITPVNPKKKKHVTERIINLVLSDLHIGSNIKVDETGVLNYGQIEESRRLAKVIQETIEYKYQYREWTKLNVFLLGDIIQGMLGHDPRDGAELAEQMARAIHLLSQGLSQLAENFNEIEVHCQTGNHGRNITRHAGRAIHGKYDSFETVLYYSLKNVLVKYKHVTFKIDKTPYGYTDLFGARLLYSHGDTFVSVGSVGKTVNVASIEGTINRFNASLKDQDEIKVVLLGHLHIGNITYMGNGCTLLVNPALCPPDDFAVSIGHLESQSGQFLFESVPGYPMGDVRMVKVTSTDDKNEELDAVISPWVGF